MRTSLRSTAPLLLALLPLACSDPSGPEPIEQLPRSLSVAEEAVIDASNRFAFSLAREVNRSQPGENLFLSPLSASMALGMTMNGARGTTLDGMRGALGFDALELQQINRSYRDLIQLLGGLDRRVEMRVANSVWYRREFPFEPSFLNTTKEFFAAEVSGLDFADPASVGKINSWVDRSTNGKIKDIVERIDSRDVMYLINAIYFKGSWTHRFDPARTRDERFTTLDGRQVTVKMMNRDGSLLYRQTPDYEVAELPYGGGAFSMVVVLPGRDRDINVLFDGLDPSGWAAITTELAERNMVLSMPRFRLEYKKRLDDALAALGMGVALGRGPDGADFTGMSSSRGGDLFISEVLQKTYVDVNEEGTEAAAATKVTMGVTSAAPSMRIDRPFIVAIRERLTGTILFIGKVVDPNG